MNTLIKSILFPIALLLLAGCNDKNDEPSLQLCESIVSFVENNNGKVLFEYQEVNDSPMIQLRASGRLEDSRVKKGTRLLLRYTMPTGIDPRVGGDIGFVGLKLTLADTVSTVAEAPEHLGAINLTTIERSGQHLNLTAEMLNVGNREITVVTPDAPLAANGIADLYISSHIEDLATAYETPTVASLWIGPVWNRSDVKGVRVHLNNSNNPHRNEFTFLKQQ